jgi:CheY-like chemotaxis protein
MGLVSHGLSSLNTLLYCDTCDAVLLPPDRRTPRSFRPADPDLAPLFRREDEVLLHARRERWARSPGERWLCRSCRSPVGDPAEIAETPRLQGLSILVVEDDADCRELLCEFLSLTGATCVMARSGREAFPALVARPPDILLSDIRMPDGDGFELIRRVRALPPEHGGLTPAIAVSGDASPEQAMMAGFHVFARKPVDLDALTATLEEFHHAARETPSRNPCWALSSPAPGTVKMSFTGYVSAADVRAATSALLRFLEERACEILVDLHRLTGFSPAGASVAQRAVWGKRHAIRHVQFDGGPALARMVASAVCRMLGLGCTVRPENPAWGA